MADKIASKASKREGELEIQKYTQLGPTSSDPDYSES